MSLRTPFSFSNRNSQKQFEQRHEVSLLKLTPGKPVRVFFGMSDRSRLLVGVHWDDKAGKSRMCNGDADCADCNFGYRLQFHLYAAVHVMEAREFRAIIDLGTSIAKRWEANPPNFERLYEISRKDKYGPVLVHELYMDEKLKNHRNGWDISPDVDRIFKGRVSQPAMLS